MKERSDQDDKRLTKEQRQREGHAMQSEKTRQSATSPLSGRPSQRKGSVGTDNQVTAAAELLGIARNISERMKSVKRNLHQRQQEKPAKTRKNRPFPKKLTCFPWQRVKDSKSGVTTHIECVPCHIVEIVLIVPFLPHNRKKLSQISQSILYKIRHWTHWTALSWVNLWVGEGFRIPSDTRIIRTLYTENPKPPRVRSASKNTRIKGGTLYETHHL